MRVTTKKNATITEGENRNRCNKKSGNTRTPTYALNYQHLRYLIRTRCNFVANHIVNIMDIEYAHTWHMHVYVYMHKYRE